jgi:hypothetical protein
MTKVKYHRVLPARTQELMDAGRTLAIRRDKAQAAAAHAQEAIEDWIIECRGDPQSPSYTMMALSLGLTRQRVVQLATRARNRLHARYGTDG